MDEIKDEHIKKAESLLIDGQVFDKNERVPFIKELASRDLLAVPGSGKTTALLAKLYCLSKSLPFVDGSGILVLSHTNGAVDEIGKHLKPICSRLFEYPNFIGTVQSFTNKFLANPACLTKYGSYVSVNDNDIEELPVSLAKLQNLRLLQIGKNHLLSRLPDFIGDLSSLIELDVAGCGEDFTLPATIGKLKRLEILYVSPYQVIPYGIGKGNSRLKIIVK